MYPDYIYCDNDDDENITRLIVRPPVERVPSPIYRSKYRESVREEVAQSKYQHKTLGVMRVSLNAPGQYLRKNSGIHPTRPEVKHKHYRRPDYQHKLPAWEPVRLSKTSETSKNSRNSGKDFKRENILNIKTPQARTSKTHPSTDARNSSTLSKSGGPIAISGHHQRPSTKNNGSMTQGTKVKRPSDKIIRSRYLDRPPARTSTKSNETARKSSLDADKSSDDNPRRASAPALEQRPAKSKKDSKEPKGRYVSEEERDELLNGMKRKWDEMMRQFQGLPFLADTPPKAKRKSIMEEDLKQLEKDIDEIERHPHIYVYDDEGGDVKNN